MKELRDKLIGADPYLLLNMDEFALYYYLTPTNSYVLGRHARKTRGTALQHAKARLKGHILRERHRHVYVPGRFWQSGQASLLPQLPWEPASQ